MPLILKRKNLVRIVKLSLIAIVTIFILDWSGAHRHLLEEDYFSRFSYPLEVPNFRRLVEDYRNGDRSVQPTNTLYARIKFTRKANDGCLDSYKFLILVKSAPGNFQNRVAIRDTWQNSEVENSIKTVFMVGSTPKRAVVVNNEKVRVPIEDSLEEEILSFNDVIRADFVDSYYNNTIKTMMEMRWAIELCPNFQYALLIDDDYFLSMKNLGAFVNNPLQYPEPSSPELLPFSKQETALTVARLYAGYRMFVAPHRHKIGTKWYLPLWEYPYDHFPPYVTAGAILLSKAALEDIYYASLFTKHFRFDDIYVALCAKKMGIEAVHSEYFRFWSISSEELEEHLIASHGFQDPERLKRFWVKQRSVGFA